jgi:GrpB-like predicted nucleotidyltransferase (UPF0157 family)
MRLFRFDEDVCVPVSRSGSRFRLGPLTGEGADVQVEVVHLPAGGFIGGRADTREFFAMMSGSGWVSGHDGQGRDLSAGQAALWEAGEERQAGSSEGVAAVRISGRFDVWATAITQPIVVSDYDTAWAAWFETLRQRIWPAVGQIAVRIQHVGSTAVLGLAAKPVIDLDVVVASDRDVPPVIDRLAPLGYRWQGDLGVPGREAFQLIRDEQLPPHHLYLVVDNSKADLDHRLLRDLLRADPVARRRYEALKRRNAGLARDDMSFYEAAKAALVAELLTRARAEQGLPPASYWQPSPELLKRAKTRRPR